MKREFYNRLIKPISKETDQAEREIVLNYLLIGVFTLSFVALIDATLAPVISGQTFYPYRALGLLGNVFFIVGLYAVARYRGRHRLVATVLTFLIALFACFMVYNWGLLLPAGILLCSLAIVMAGILISARSALYTASGITLVFIVLQYAKAHHYTHSNLMWMRTTSTAGDVIGYTAMFFTIALVSWLFNRQMELSLKRAHRSEKALQRQKDLLEVKVEKRARQLEAAQLEKMQQLYRFAELGQLSTALFHDLANHLSTVNLDIEGLSASDQPDIMKRIQQNVGHINTIVSRVRQQIGGKSVVETFDIMNEVEEVAKILLPTADQAGVIINVSLEKSVKRPLLYKGDITRFRQVVLNLISNGIEAYPSSRRQTASRIVLVELKRQRSTLSLSVNDHGRGIRASERSKIFEPFYTTKKKGVGIGLFIVQQVVEKDFSGSLTITSDKEQGTTFVISLPKTYYVKNNRR